jgi:exodeoxyribonuclease X
MSIVVVDSETTGMGDTDQVVELAAVRLIEGPTAEDGSPVWVYGQRFSTLVRPTVPVTLEARAVHHISDADLASFPLMGDVPLPWDPTQDVLAAHNLEFDCRMLLQSGLPPAQLPVRRVCTWRCALHLYPESPSHSNQVIRYFTGVDVPPHEGAPHRALPDALVTSAVLAHMLRGHTVEELVDLTTRPALLLRVPFGKSRGRPWADMDTGFLEWVLSPKQDFNEDIKATARYWHERGRGRVAVPGRLA